MTTLHPFDPAFVAETLDVGRVLRCPALPAPHLFTTRDVNVRVESDGAAAARAAIAIALGVGPGELAGATQVHGCDVRVVRRGDPSPPEQPSADILVCDDPARAIGVRIADCVPLLLADGRLGVVAAAHGGWRGTCLGVARRAVEALAREFGTRATDVVAAIGPCIGPEAYEVGDEVEAMFRDVHGEAAARWFRKEPGGRTHLDLWTATSDQLAAAGVPLNRSGARAPVRVRTPAGSSRTAAKVRPPAACSAPSDRCPPSRTTPTSRDR